MPHFCSVIKCSMRAERDKVSFFRFPAVLTNRGDHLNALSGERRNAWIKSLKRGPLSDSQLRNGRICSKHFISGKPATLEDKINPDWIPNQNLGYISSLQPSTSASTRFERSIKRARIETEDEVLAISEKVVIRLEDLITWITVEAEWTWGRLAKCEEELKDVSVEPEQLALPRKPAGNSFSISESTLDFSDVEQETEKLEPLLRENARPHVIILSFPKYCRYRAMMKRLEGVENLYIKYKIVNALGGFYVLHPNTRVLFCRDTFDYPELEGHELLCNHLAPKLKGRPRGKRKKRSISPGSESNESESSLTNHYTRSADYKSNGARSDSPMATRRSTRCHENNENKQFVKVISAFMKAKRIPMGRVPSLGYKELNLHEFFTKVQKLGGYDCVTINRLWKSIFDDMTGHLNSTSAATIIRRHYERFLLPYERHLKGEEYKPLPVSERRRLKSKRGRLPSSSRTSDSESSNETTTGTSRSSSTPPASNYNKESSPPGKPSSLRSIRVKPERQKDRQSSVSDKVSANNQSNLEQTIKTEPEDVKPVVDNSVVKSESTEVKVNVKVEVTVETKIEIKVENEENNVTEELKVKEEVEAEIKDESISPKSEPDEIKPSTPEGSKTEVSIPDNSIEPVTSAVAPIVVTSIPDKMLSPVEGKENIPIIKTGDIATDNAIPEVVNIPFKAKTPEIVQIDSDAYKKLGESFIHDVKRIKLDILKEGGLEVTPVKPGLASPLIKEIRPSVIQLPSHNDTSKTIMPPPLLSNVLPKRNHASSLLPSINITQIKGALSSPVKDVKSDSFQFVNGATPPKVVQSKSIYSYSEKTIYGNPKDFLQPVIPPQTPKCIGSSVRQGGSDPMDLSITSPQKPVIEIMRIPQSSTSNAQTPYNRDRVTKNLYKTSPPVLDGRRLGSNLEITLVGPKAPVNSSYVTKPSSHKRSSSETYAQKIAKLKAEENSSKQNKYNFPHMHKNKVEFPVPSRFPKSHVSGSGSKTDVRHAPPPQKPLVPPMPQTLPPYLARFATHDNTNGLNPYLPLMDSLYYQAALQNVYSNMSNMSNMPPPMLPLPTPEQLKFYAELMAHGRMNFPTFSLPNDGHSSMNNNKKP